MTECPRESQLLAALMNGEPEDRLSPLLEHSQSCAGCRELVELHRRLEESVLAGATNEELRAMRAQVLRRLRSKPAKRRLGGFRTPVVGWRAALTAAAGLVLLLGTFSLGRWTAPMPESGTSTDSVEESPPALQVLTNLRIQEVDDSYVRLSYDAVSHREETRPKNDPLVAEALLQALSNPEPIRTRLAAIEIAEHPEPRVRTALIRAMLEDPNLAVRLRALTKLAEMPMDTSTQGALLTVLRQEDSVQMRLEAIDALAAARIEPRQIEEAVQDGPPEPGTAVYAKAQDYSTTF